MQESKRQPFYICPNQRYTYVSPGGAASAREGKTSPFLSFWYCDMVASTAPFITWWREAESLLAKEKAAKEANPPKKKSYWALKREAGAPVVEVKPLLPIGTTLVGDTSKLPHRMRAQYDKTRKRLRKKQREAIQRRIQEKKRIHRKEQARLRRKAWYG